MRRAVITGLGIVSSIGTNQQEVTASLKEGKSGITYSEQFAEMGLRSQVWGNIDIDLKEHIDRKAMRFMGDAAAYAYVAMQQAVEDSGLEASDISNIRTGIVAGSGGASSDNQVASADILREKGVKEVSALSRPLDEDLQGATVEETATEAKPAIAAKPEPAPKAAPAAPAATAVEVEVETDVDRAVPRKPFSKAMESMELRYKVLTRILGLRGIENSKRAQVAQSLAALKEVRNRDLETPRT